MLCAEQEKGGKELPARAQHYTGAVGYAAVRRACSRKSFPPFWLWPCCSGPPHCLLRRAALPPIRSSGRCFSFQIWEPASTTPPASFQCQRGSPRSGLDSGSAPPMDERRCQFIPARMKEERPHPAICNISCDIPAPPYSTNVSPGLSLRFRPKRTARSTTAGAIFLRTLAAQFIVLI